MNAIVIECLENLNTMTKTQEKTSNPLGQWVRSNREERRWSLRRLADEMHNVCDASYISQLETDKYRGKKNKPMRPGDVIIEAFAKVFDTPLNYVRKLADYAPVDEDNETLAVPEDGELAYLFAASRNWSEENRREAYENAKVIFQRYQKKDKESRKKIAEETGDDKKNKESSNPFLKQVEKDYEKMQRRLRETDRSSGEDDEHNIPIPTADDDDASDGGYIAQNGKLVALSDEPEKPAATKKPSRNKREGDK